MVTLDALIGWWSITSGWLCYYPTRGAPLSPSVDQGIHTRSFDIIIISISHSVYKCTCSHMHRVYVCTHIYTHMHSHCRPPADLPRAFETGVWLQGAGSFLALNSARLSLDGGVSVSLSFRTLKPSGTILYLTSSDLVAYIIVYVDNGWVWLDYSQTGLDRTRIRTTSTYTDGQWYALSVQLNQQGVVLTVNGTDVVQGGSPTIMPGAFNSTNYLFIGGVSPQVEEVVETLRPSLSGCVREISINDQLLDLQQNTNSYRVSLGGCPEQVSYFTDECTCIAGYSCQLLYSMSIFIVATRFIRYVCQ